MGEVCENQNKSYITETFQMAWPAVLESFFVALAGMVDSLMVSSMGAYAVAAVGLTTQPKFIGISLFLAINVAVSALVARRRGQQDQYGANQILMTALMIILTLGIVASVLCVRFADSIIRFCGSEPDTHESAVLYFQIIMGGMMFNIISLVINAAQRGAGRTKIAMRTNVTANTLNMIGNYLLIGGNCGFPALGIRGAALATVFGTVVACIMSIGSLFDKNGFVNVFYMMKNRVRPAKAALAGIRRVGGPILVERLLVRVGFLSAAMMTANLGTEVMAAHQVASNVMSLSFSFGDGMQAAAVALIGRSLGEEKPELAKTYGSICQRMGLGISMVLAVIYLLFGRPFYALYFEEAHIVEMGVQVMRIMVVIVMLQISQVIYMGCLRGAGDVKFTTVVSTFSISIVRTSCAYLLCYVCGLGWNGIWLGVVCDQICRFSLTRWRFKSGVWTKMKI